MALFLLPLTISLVWLCVDAPVPFLREAWFVLLLWALTGATRTVSWRAALSALAFGIGVAAPAMVFIGFVMSKAGLDVSESVFGSWAVVPVLEELVKLVPVGLVAVLHRRRSGLTLNPSDWLLLGCAAGAGFAMVENAQLVRQDPGVLTDMARQYGPTWLVPGAWGATGFVGHAAATGLAAAGIGLSHSLARVATARGTSTTLAWVAWAAPFCWVTLEHMLANLRVNTGSELALALGNGRLTPWLFLAATALVTATDLTWARRTLAHSRTLRQRWALRPALRQIAAELRVLNATAWLTRERLARSNGGTPT